MTVIQIKEEMKKVLCEPFDTEEKSEPLSTSVRKALKNYFDQLKGEEPREFYQMILSEVEVPLLEVVMKYTRKNQSRTATILGLSRGNLRKKLKAYGML
jgi:Fis family transcriptional regulator